MNDICKHLVEYDNYHINEIYRTVRFDVDEDNTLKKFWYYFLLMQIHVLISKILVLLNLVYYKKYSENTPIGFARVSRTQEKLIRVRKDIIIITDDVKKRDFSIYKLTKRRKRIKYLIFDFGKDCDNMLKEIYNIIGGIPSLSNSDQILYKLLKRIPHTEMYRYAIDDLLRENTSNEVFTGQMYDRFAHVESMLSKKYLKKLICIPHGIESVEVFPMGYVGDIFYASSNLMASELNTRYKTNKFIYDRNIVNLLFRVKSNELVNNSDRKIVFFTQNTMVEETQTIIRRLSEFLKELDLPLYLKVHPNESVDKYKVDNICCIDNFETAISGNICISYISTSLVEALYNNSIAISIVYMIRKEETLDNMFFFLKDERIIKPKEIDELYNILNSLI